MTQRLDELKKWAKREMSARTILGSVFQIFYKASLANCLWLVRLRVKSTFSRRTKIGFGPIVTGEKTLSTRKWHIDPVVNYINKHSNRYICDVFFQGDDLSRFDIIVIVKNFDRMDRPTLEELKKKKKILIYDIADNPFGCQKSYLEEDWYIKSLDGIIINNPLVEEDIKEQNPNFRLIGLPLINNRYKKDYKSGDVVNILWEGVSLNIKHTTDIVNPIIREFEKDGSYKIRMIYHSDLPTKTDGAIEYVKWRLSNWERMLVRADIAIVIKPSSDKRQQRKPSTKVNTYRAAGLPVVCTPSEADKKVIEHGKTGYFANTPQDWQKYLSLLIRNPKIREEVGRAGREYVVENFSIGKVAQEYIDFFDQLVIDKRQEIKRCMD